MRTRKPARLFGVFVTLFMLAACAPLAVTPAPQAEPAAIAPITALVDPASATPIRILFIGDTQIMANQGLDVHLQHMAAAADPPLTVDASKIAYDQVTLAEIWAASDAATVIRQGDWDVVVLQNIGTRQAEEFETAVAAFAGAVAEAGATPLILAQWDNVNDPQAEAAHAVGARLGIPVAPAAAAWEAAMTERPDLALRIGTGEWQATIPGTYLNTAVLYATIFGLNPQENPYRPVQLLPDLETVAASFKRDMERLHQEWTISDEDAAFLRQIAWEAATRRE